MVSFFTKEQHNEIVSPRCRPSGQPCIETKEFDLLRNMLIAAVEERYRDAGRLFDHIVVVHHSGLQVR